MKLFDSIAKKNVEFEPREDGKVSMYVCGPTVYDHPHLGHARTYSNFDTIRNIFGFLGNEVTYVINITDINDKIVKRAAEENRTESDVAIEFEDSYWDVIRKLNVKEPTFIPHATDFVEEMIDIIKVLEEKDIAYTTSSGVYFRVSKKDDYGKLSGRSIELLTKSAGARVEIDEEKEKPVDFALWKFPKSDEPTWDSPWGKGRPGWHIECSAMSLEYLGEGFDIHGGGADLTFPHHENEIAQSEGAGLRFANYWMHSEMLNLEGRKMAKSEKHFVPLQEALDTYGPAVLRISFLFTHYREVMEYSSETLENAKSALKRIRTCFRRGYLLNVGTSNDEAIKETFLKNGLDDFNTPKMIANIFDEVKRLNSIELNEASNTNEVQSRYENLLGALQVLGLKKDWLLEDDEVDEALATTVEELLSKRSKAKEEKNYELADQIRNELDELDVVIEDTDKGATWRKK